MEQALDSLPMEQIGEMTWLVQSSSGDAWYDVSVSERTCTCADFQSRRRVCKHLRQVLVHVGRAPD
jgi:hypothetical protein